MLIPSEKTQAYPPPSASSWAPEPVKAKAPLDDESAPIQGSPPPYASPPAESGSMSATSTEPRLPERPASNFVTIISDNHSVKDTFVIDPTLPIPRDLVGDAEKNLFVMSKNGRVVSDVWLVRSGEGEQHGSEPNHATLDFQSKNGSVTVYLNSLTDCTYDLNVWSKNGAVTVAIPSSFVGPMMLEAHNGSIKLSDNVKERLTTFNDVNKKRTCFIGDFKTLGYTAKDKWRGSSIKIGSDNGAIKLSFVDEKPLENTKGFWSKLLN